MPWLSNLTPRCRTCDRPRLEGETFSRRGRCDDCGEGRQIENRRHLRAHSGHWFQHWRRGVAASVGALLVDEFETDD